MTEWRSEWYEDEDGNGWRYTEDDEGNWEHETWGPDQDSGGVHGCFTSLAPVAALAGGAALLALRRAR